MQTAVGKECLLSLGMSTRKGNVVLLEEVLDEAYKRVRDSLDATPTTKVDNRIEVSACL